jgi:PhzF family phenazine biosynthesis protein
LKIKAGLVQGHYSRATNTASASMPHNVHLHGARVALSSVLASQPALAKVLSSQGDNTVAMDFPLVSPARGISFVLVELSSLEHLAAVAAGGVRIDMSSSPLDAEWRPSFTAPYYYVILGDEPGKIKLRSRMIEPLIGEDPATGAAAVACTSYLSLTRAAKGKRFEFLIEQGVEMGRKSDIQAEVCLKESGKEVDTVVLKGSAVVIMEGKITV